MAVNTTKLGEFIIEGFRKSLSLSPAAQWGKALTSVLGEVQSEGVEDILTPCTRLTSSTTLSDSPGIFLVDPPGVGVTITLPASPSDNRRIIVKNIDGGGNTVTVDGGARNIDGAGTVVLAGGSYDTVSLVYNATTNQWWKI